MFYYPSEKGQELNSGLFCNAPPVRELFQSFLVVPMKPASVGLLTGHTNLIFLNNVESEGQTEVRCFKTF